MYMCVCVKQFRWRISKTLISFAVTLLHENLFARSMRHKADGFSGHFFGFLLLLFFALCDLDIPSGSVLKSILKRQLHAKFLKLVELYSPFGMRYDFLYSIHTNNK